MLEENTTENQSDVIQAPAVFDDGLDDILGEATSMLYAASENEDENAASSDVSGDEGKTSDSTSTSGQNRAERAGNKHSAQNRIAFFKRLSAEAEERAEGYRIERDGLARENHTLQARIKEVEALLADTERHVQSLMRATPQTGFNAGGDFDQNGTWVPSQTPTNTPPTHQPYRENDPNRPLTFADLQKFTEKSKETESQQLKQEEAQRKFDALMKGWHPHLENSSKNGFDPDVVQNIMTSALRDATEAKRAGNPALVHALEIIKDLDHPIETLNALRTMPGYKTMSLADISKNVAKLNNGLVLRKRAHTKASASPELKSGASPAREPNSYAEHKRQKVAALKGR